MNRFENSMFSTLESEKYEVQLENREFTVRDRDTGTILTSDALNVWELRHVIDKCISLMDHNNNVKQKLIKEDFHGEREMKQYDNKRCFEQCSSRVAYI